MKETNLISLAKDHGIEKLKKETGLSRSHIYGILKGEVEPGLSTYKKLLDALGYKIDIKKIRNQKEVNQPSLESEKYFRWSLAYYGAPLLAEKNFKTSAPPIDLVVLEALTRGRFQADICSVLPNFLYKNWKKINWDKIIEETEEPLFLGYLLHLIFHFMNDFKVNLLLADLQKKHQPRKKQILIKKEKTNRFEKNIFRRTKNPIAEAWKFQTTDNLDEIEKRFNKWQDKKIS